MRCRRTKTAGSYEGGFAARSDEFSDKLASICAIFRERRRELGADLDLYSCE
jgi:hypothetical protein